MSRYYQRRQLKFRTGQIGAAGGRPINEHSRTIRTVTAGVIGVSATTAGDTGVFDLSQIGTPADMPATTTFATLGTSANHPSEWPEIIAGGWEAGRCLNSMYRFNIRFRGTNSATKDFVFAYKFGIASTAAIVLTAGDVTIDAWKDMRQSRGWVWQRFSGTNTGGSVHASQGIIQVKVPSVYRLAEKLFDQGDLTESVENQLEMPIQDAATTATLRPFLHIAVFTVEGVAFTASDVMIEITVYQKVKLMRGINVEDMIDEADQVS